MFACQYQPAQIAQHKWQLNFLYNPQSLQISEFLSIYVSINHIDHSREMPDLVLKYPTESLFWRLHANKEVVQYQSLVYSHSRIMIPDQPLPRGKFILELESRGVIFDTKEIIVNQMRLNTIKIKQFPQLKNNKIIADKAINLIIFDKQGQYKNKKIVQPNEVINSLGAESNVYLYVWLDNEHVGLFTGPYVLN
jgi:hypothetical protein